MSARARRASGWLIAVGGFGIAAFFLADVVSTPEPAYWVLQAYPIALSLALGAGGVALARGRLVADRFTGRLFAWMVVGTVAMSLCLAWFYVLAVVFNDRLPLDLPAAILFVPCLGALMGLLIGAYDARAIERQEAITRLSQLNETLRITTGELVERADRDALERAVCERLVESESVDAAWVARYENGDARPSAWAGLDDDAVASLAVAADGGDSTRASVDGADDGASGHTGPEETPTEPWHDALGRLGFESVAVAPVVGSGDSYGLIGVCARGLDAFDDDQRAAFADLGRTVGHAVDSVRAHDELAVRERDLLRQNDRLDEFASVVSHDLRNPLNVILGRTELLKEEGTNEGLDAIQRSGTRMEEIISDLLALSRTSRSVVDFDPVSLAAVATESWLNVASDGASLDIETTDATTLRADPSRLRTVFENLFRNAIDHNDPPLVVRVGLLGDGDAPDGFFVEDDGTGIPAAEREAVFDPGYTTGGTGTGLGLAIVRGATDAHGWEISAHVGADGGARFEITGVEIGG